jgi:hypothetical protein
MWVFVRRFDFWFMLTLIRLLFIMFLCSIRVEKSRHIDLNILIVSLCWRLQFMCFLFLLNRWPPFAPLSVRLPQTLRLNIEELQLLGEAWADRHRVLERSLTSSSSSSASAASAASGKPAAGASSSSSSPSTNAHIRALSALFRHRDTSVDEKEVIEDRLEVRQMRRIDIRDKIPHPHAIDIMRKRHLFGFAIL